jgi:Ca2+-binding EF-hand superfamily protein
LKILLVPIIAFSGAVFAQQPQMPNFEELMLKQLDTDQNGEIDRQEFMQPTVTQFERMDTNQDGILDGAELRAFNDEMQRRIREMQQMQQQMPPGMPNR